MLYSHPNGIALRKVEARDLSELADLKNESWFGTHRVSFVSAASQEKWLAGLNAEDIHSPKNLVLIACMVLSDMPAPNPYDNIGVLKILDIDWQSRRASVGWDVYKSCRGGGLGKKLVKAGVDFCFGVLNLHRLQADILANNEVSQKCAEAAGFVQEGYQPKTIRRGGEWIDNVIYGIVSHAD